MMARQRYFSAEVRRVVARVLGQSPHMQVYLSAHGHTWGLNLEQTLEAIRNEAEGLGYCGNGASAPARRAAAKAMMDTIREQLRADQRAHLLQHGREDLLARYGEALVTEFDGGYEPRTWVPLTAD